MRLWCLDDAGLWGRQLQDVALSRGWKAKLFATCEDVRGAVPGDFVFMRIAQESVRREREKALMQNLHRRNCILIPDFRSGMLYEDKLGQTLAFAEWMPDTGVYRTPEAARNDVRRFGFPFLSKSATGSASRNVRIVYSERQAHDEIDAAFGRGIEAGHKLGEKQQRGYLLWQEFLGGNPYDYRVVRVGRYNMLLQRHNKPGTPFASGSGINNPVNVLTDESAAVLTLADQFFNSEGLSWCGIDVVRDSVTNEWLLLETTLGWSAKAYENCLFFGTSYHGCDIWHLLCDEIEAGVFG